MNNKINAIENDTSKTNGVFLGFLKNGLHITPAGLLGLVILLLLPNIAPFNQEYMIRWLVMGTFIAAGAIAFDFTGGYIGIVNFGFHAFVGLGGYTSGILAHRIGLSPWLGLFAGGIFAGALGFVLGVLTLRLRGIYAAVVAWFVGLALMGLATKLVWLTRGPLGLRVDRLFDSPSNKPYYYLIFIIMMIVYLITRKVVNSKIGLAFKAIGQNMEAAKTSGINPFFYRVSNFTISCTIAGFLGGFYAHYYGILTPELLHTTKTVEVLAVAYLAGRASLWGGIAVGIPFVFFTELMRSSLTELPGLNLVFYGLMLVWVMIYYPGGFAMFYDSITRKIKNTSLKRFFRG
ncbi:MAG: branched-chain amino acid ABC transporter permease [Deltaproteobacteria bacterium]|jgi:branched-chain amino acid transport system permease protein|nr:branched-chain amino acid ABC transporter permease [Deltaproteobacteria bacterium]